MFNFHDLIGARIYTYHDSFAVVAYAQLWPDKIITLHLRVIQI